MISFWIDLDQDAENSPPEAGLYRWVGVWNGVDWLGLSLSVARVVGGPEMVWRRWGQGYLALGSLGRGDEGCKGREGHGEQSKG